MAERANRLGAREGRRLQQPLHGEMDAARRGQFQKSVGNRIGAQGEGENDASEGGAPKQAAGQHPAAKKVIAGRGQAGSAAADDSDARGKTSGGVLREGPAEQEVPGMLLAREGRCGKKEGYEAFRGGMAGQGGPKDGLEAADGIRSPFGQA